jgi:hypothetical protein
MQARPAEYFEGEHRPVDRNAQWPNASAVGVGLKAAHYALALDGAHNLDCFEVHAENFMGEGGPPQRWLAAFRQRFPVSIHGVCLSVGGRDPLDADHLDRLARLVERAEPALVSEHFAWSADSGKFLNDLLPQPLTAESPDQTCAHVGQIQDRLKSACLG